MGGVTSTSFGLVIAYLLPGLMAFYGASLFSEPAAAVFSTFLTADSNVALFLMVVLAALALGVFAQATAWAVIELLVFRLLFAKERTLLTLKFRGRILFAGFKCQPLERISQADYDRLREPGRLSAYRAYIDEIYRYYQFWSGTAVVLPLLLVGWGWHGGSEWSEVQVGLYAAAAVAAELVVFAKCTDSWIGTNGAGLAILREATSGQEEKRGEAEDRN